MQSNISEIIKNISQIHKNPAFYPITVFVVFIIFTLFLTTTGPQEKTKSSTPKRTKQNKSNTPLRRSARIRAQELKKRKENKNKNK